MANYHLISRIYNFDPLKVSIQKYTLDLTIGNISMCNSIYMNDNRMIVGE